MCAPRPVEAVFHRYIYFKIDPRLEEHLLQTWSEVRAQGVSDSVISGSSHQLERRCHDAKTWMEVYRNYPDERALDRDQEFFDRKWLPRLQGLAPEVERHVETFRSCV